jgi:hypothetical protein
VTSGVLLEQAREVPDGQVYLLSHFAQRLIVSLILLVDQVDN